MENRIPDPLCPAEPRNESKRIEKSADAFHRKNADQYRAEKRDHSRDGIQVERVAQQNAIPDGQPSPEHQQNGRRNRDHADPAELDQQQDHDLSEQRPVRIGVHDDQSGHTDRCGRGKQCRQKRSPFARSRCGRQQQQDRSDGNQKKKAERNDLCRRPG